MKLDNRSVTRTSPALPAGKTDMVFWDDDIPGLGLRVRASGVKSWVFQYWHGEKNHKMTLDKWPKLLPDQARQIAREHAAMLALGRDPKAEKADANVRKLTVGEVIGSYLEFKAKELRPRSLVEVKRHLQVHAAPLHGTAIKALTREQVADLLRAVTKSSGPVGSNRMRASLSALLTWAVREGKVDINVAASTNKEREGSRERVLTDAELGRIWAALPASDFGSIVKLLMLTGQRRDEIAGLRWSEIDLATKQINLPASRTKNARPHVVPLSAPALSIIKAIPQTSGCDFVFGYGDNAFSGFAKSKARLDQQLPDIQAWVLHDLRRTFATRAADLGVLPHVIEMAINHVSGHKSGVAGVYNKSTHGPEVREALDKWGQHVVKIVSKRGALKVA